MSQPTISPADQGDEDDSVSDVAVKRKTLAIDSFDIGVQPAISLNKQTFDKFKDTALSYRENVREILANNGNRTVFDFTKSFTRENRNKISRDRRPELISTFSESIRKVLGSAIAASVAKQLKGNSSMSSSQKSVPFSNPFTINATLQNALPYFAGGNDPSLQNVIVLGCANMSFNNWNHPKGHLVHTFKNGNPEVAALPFFGHTYDAKPILYQEAYKMDSIIDVKGRIEKLRRDGYLDKTSVDKIRDLLDTVYASPHALSQDTYVDQLSVTNYMFFKELFRDYKKFLPNLIYMSQEMLTLELILNHHIDDKTIIHRLIFDKNLEELIYKHFEGIRGTFVRSTKYGTYLFWGTPKDGKYKVKLWKEGNYLVSKDKSFKLELTPDAIRTAIQNKEVIPSMFLVFLTLCFYYGLIIGGGYVQTLFVGQMKEKYLDFLQEIGESHEIEASSDVPTDSFVVAFSPFAVLKYKDIRLQATGLDLYLHGNGGRAWADIFQATKTLTLEELVNRTLPSYYREFCPDDKKDELFAQITEADIEKFTGLDQKIPPWAEVSYFDQSR